MASWPRWLQWLLLVGLSAALAGLLELARLPAALLIGPMIAGIVAGTNGADIRLPKSIYAGSQAIVGCLIAASIELELFTALVTQWPVVLGATFATLAASGLLGWLVSRWNILPGTTAIWGSAPGAASAMVLMADAFGADARLVAFMQYVRVIMVSVAAALIAGLFVDTSAIETAPMVWFPPLEWPSFAATLGVAAVGAAAGTLVRLPSATFLGPMILGVALHLSGLVDFQLPEWLLALSFAAIGWSIGLRFTRPIVAHAFRALPQIMIAVLVLIGFCGALAVVVSRITGVDALTAYLATSPGGMDTVAIVAAASDSVDINFVMSMQTMRFLIVLLLGPPVARYFAGKVKP
ncbi:MAG: AbrB family transcriptional regulator [Mesorhizobium sp.]|nr:AbrB family transcriptional regulator [Mesorhizobium sp.]